MKGLNVFITELSGYSFEVKWNRNINIVKRKIAKHFNEKNKHDQKEEIQYEDIELIYNGEILELLGSQKKIEITCEEIQKNNNMYVVILKRKSEYSYDETETDTDIDDIPLF